MKILIVDDSKVIRRVLNQDLTEMGLDIVGEAGDGNTALEMFREKQPDIVTLDITMPGMNGMECLEEMLAVDPKANILIVSALAGKNVAIDAMSKGARAYLTKPIDKEKLQQTIQKILDNG